MRFQHLFFFKLSVSFDDLWIKFWLFFKFGRGPAKYPRALKANPIDIIKRFDIDIEMINAGDQL